MDDQDKNNDVLTKLTQNIDRLAKAMELQLRVSADRKITEDKKVESTKKKKKKIPMNLGNVADQAKKGFKSGGLAGAAKGGISGAADLIAQEVLTLIKNAVKEAVTASKEGYSSAITKPAEETTKWAAMMARSGHQVSQSDRANMFTQFSEGSRRVQKGQQEARMQFAGSEDSWANIGQRMLFGGDAPVSQWYETTKATAQDTIYQYSAENFVKQQEKASFRRKSDLSQAWSTEGE